MSHAATMAQRSRVARVVIADDHDLARAGLRGLLSGERGIEVVGEAASGREALELCRRARPDLVLQLLRQMSGTTAEAHLESTQLTRREHDVLRLIVLGQTNREIAGTLNLTVSTVKTHVEHVIGKLEVSDRTQAAVRAIELGLASAHSS